jgi:hypothetical protein
MKCLFCMWWYSCRMPLYAFCEFIYPSFYSVSVVIPLMDVKQCLHTTKLNYRYGSKTWRLYTANEPVNGLDAEPFVFNKSFITLKWQQSKIHPLIFIWNIEDIFPLEIFFFLFLTERKSRLYVSVVRKQMYGHGPWYFSKRTGSETYRVTQNSALEGEMPVTSMPWKKSGTPFQLASFCERPSGITFRSVPSQKYSWSKDSCVMRRRISSSFVIWVRKGYFNKRDVRDLFVHSSKQGHFITKHITSSSTSSSRGIGPYIFEQSSPATHHGGAWGERRYSSYSFTTSALDRCEWSASRPGRALSPGKGPPVPTGQEAGWAPEPVWTQRIEEKSFVPVGDRTPISRWSSP